MTPDTVVDLGREAMTIALMMAAPMLFVALATGLVVGLFQAATQIQEQTLSFIPKLVAIACVVGDHRPLAVTNHAGLLV